MEYNFKLSDNAVLCTTILFSLFMLIGEGFLTSILYAFGTFILILLLFGFIFAIVGSVIKTLR